MCEVVRSNFNELFPLIDKSIKNADFISIDTEFTGLSASLFDQGSLFDSADDRYQKLRRSVSQFTLSQIDNWAVWDLGFSTFAKDTSSAQSNNYLVQTFNCPVFPVAFGPNDPKFLIQASSFQFLCNHKFDFNKFVYEGVPYLNEEQEKKLVQYLKNSDDAEITDRIEDERLIQHCCSLVADWIVRTADENALVFDLPGGVTEYTLSAEIHQRFPQVWCEMISISKMQVVKCSVERREQLENDHKLKSEEKILNEMLGFTRVFRLMVSYKKPIVGHNSFMDLVFLYDKFHKPLPSSYKKFKSDIHLMFPVVLDTKHISSVARRMFSDRGLIEQTGLSDLYESLNGLKGQSFTIYSPAISYAPGFEKYKGVHAPHEAGYDSYMCGSAFLRMAHILASANSRTEDIRPMLFREYMVALRPYSNIINVIRASVEFIRLDGDDPKSVNIHYLYIKSLKAGTPLKQFSLANAFSQYGSIDIQIKDATSAILAVRNHKCVKEILEAYKHNKNFLISRYSPWRHNPAYRTSLLIGAVLSGSVCIWALWNAPASNSK